MVRRKRSTWVVALNFALIALAVIALGTSSASSVMAAKKDFLLTLNIKPQDGIGQMNNDGGAGPVYPSVAFGTCAYILNFFSLVSLNGFEGNVTVEVLNLPPGVTEEVGDSFFLRSGSSTGDMIVLEATAAAPLGDATVTLRAMSGNGNIVHTIDLPFTIVGQLPPPDCS